MTGAGAGGMRPWARAAVAMFAVGWGANQFSSLLLAYRVHAGVSEGVADALFGCYALGLIPALLICGPLSDRLGRRALARAAIVVSALASVVLIAGVDGVGWLYAGRLLAGVASGTVFAPGTAWVKELSSPPWAAAGERDSGARRAAVALSAGFGLGPLVAGVVAQWAPDPLVSPYVAHLVVVTGAAVLVWTAPETVTERAVSAFGRVVVPSLADPRFRRVVAPLAPWVFISASISLAIGPALVSRRVGGAGVVFAGVLAGLTLGSGVLVQPLARRWDGGGTAGGVAGRAAGAGGGERGTGTAVGAPGPARTGTAGTTTRGAGLLACAAGALLEAGAAATAAPALAVAAAIVLGAGYGCCLVGGLLATQLIAAPADLAGLTAVFYALTYLGFAAPLVLAELTAALSYSALLLIVAACALGTFVLINSHSRKRFQD